MSGTVCFDLNESIDETISIYRTRFKARKIQVERHFAVKLTICAVKREFRQVNSNLLANALGAISEHGILRRKTVAVEEHSVMLRVTDNGCGISPAMIRRVFEPFFTTKQFIGTELGLWVSKSIVDKHGGELRVTSCTEARYTARHLS